MQASEDQEKERDRTKKKIEKQTREKTDMLKLSMRDFARGYIIKYTYNVIKKMICCNMTLFKLDVIIEFNFLCVYFFSFKIIKSKLSNICTENMVKIYRVNFFFALLHLKRGLLSLRFAQTQVCKIFSFNLTQSLKQYFEFAKS